jgi:hypothetical protein
MCPIHLTLLHGIFRELVEMITSYYYVLVNRHGVKFVIGFIELL